MATDPAWDIELPEGPHRDEFQTSCLICHSARLPLGQPPFDREKWAEIVHKMVAVYGAPMTPEDESMSWTTCSPPGRPAPDRSGQLARTSFPPTRGCEDRMATSNEERPS